MDHEEKLESLACLDIRENKVLRYVLGATIRHFVHGVCISEATISFGAIILHQNGVWICSPLPSPLTHRVLQEYRGFQVLLVPLAIQGSREDKVHLDSQGPLETVANQGHRVPQGTKDHL